MVASLVEQTGRMMSLGYDLHVGNLRKRVARYLLRLADTPLTTQDVEGHRVLQVTHALVAEGTDSIRESVSQELPNLRREGLIRTASRGIALLDEQELDEIVHEPLLDRQSPSRKRRKDPYRRNHKIQSSATPRGG